MTQTKSCCSLILWKTSPNSIDDMELLCLKHLLKFNCPGAKCVYYERIK